METGHKMTAITVELRNSTPQGRLYPRYDTEADLLVIESQIAHRWPMGINIDGRVILDVDAERMLANVDLLISRRYWKVGTKPLLPLQPSEADLLLSEASLMHKNFHRKLTIVSDESKSWVYMQFGEAQAEHSWIALSTQCFAELSTNELLGFYIIL
jgi:hypothetical protein